MYVYICMYEWYLYNEYERVYILNVCMYTCMSTTKLCMSVCMYVCVYSSYLEKFANEYEAGFVAVQ